MHTTGVLWIWHARLGIILLFVIKKLSFLCQVSLQGIMMGYTLVLMLKEILQFRHMRSLGENMYKLYMSQASNITNWVAITCVFATVIILNVDHSENLTKKVQNLQNLLLFVVLLTWFQICTDLLQCLPSATIQKNLGMFFYVAKAYVKILAGFAPFFVAFAASFRGEGVVFLKRSPSLHKEYSSSGDYLKPILLLSLFFSHG